MKKKVLLTGILSIVMCLSLIAGATFALFTSESKVNIAVTSGNVEVVAYVDVDSVEYKSLKVTDWTDATNGYTAFDGMGSSATVTEKSVVLDKIIPGDALRFSVIIENNSTVTVNTRTIIENDALKDTGLFGLLNVKVGGATLEDAIVSDWAQINPESTDVVVPVEIVFPKEETVQNKSCEINVIVEAVQGNADVKNSFNDNADGSYTIADKYGLISFQKSVNAGNSYTGKTILLGADIDLANATWTPIGNYNTAFEGNFDGGNHTISNLYINDVEGDTVGLFGVAQYATIKNVKVKNVNVTSYQMTAAIVAYPYVGCTISNCHVSGDINIKSSFAYAGGISAYGYVDIENCSVIADGTGYITAQDRNAVGGISAWSLEGDNRITNCQVKNLELTGWANIGSITGFVHYTNTISGCSAENVVITKTRVGGNGTLGYVAGGWSYGANKSITISNNAIKNVVLNGNYTANANNLKGMNVMFGGEYGAGASSEGFFVMENNTLENVTDNRYAKVETATELKNTWNIAFDGMVIGFINDIEGDVTLVQKPDVKVVIDGFDYNYAGSITIDGKSARYATTGLTIKNINFVAETIANDACIRLGDGTNDTRYVSNLKVIGCTFNVPGKVAIKSYTGGDHNLTIDDCIVHAGAHSLLQVANVEVGLVITNCKVYSKNGVNLNSTPSVTMNGCTFDVTGYAIRVGVNGQDAFVGQYNFKNNTLKSACNDGDSVIIIRSSAVGSTLDLTDSTITGSSEISGNNTTTTIIR